MYRILCTVAFALISACDSVPPEAPYRYESLCLTFESEAVLKQEALDFNVALARDYLIGEVKAIKDDAEFCRRFAGTRIYVYDLDTLPDSNKTGRFNSLIGIKLSRSMNALFHELLHVVHSQHCQLGTAWHESWLENGYYYADFRYGLRIQRVYPQQQQHSAGPVVN